MKHKLMIPLIITSFLGSSAISMAAPGSKLIFKEDFNSRSLKQWNYSGQRASVTNSPTRSGNYAAQFSLRRGKGKNFFRSELVIKKGRNIFKMGQEYWVGASIFIPSTWVNDFYSEILLQFHAVPDTHLGEKWSGRNPPIALNIVGKNWRLQNYSDPRPLTRDKKYRGQGYNLGPYKKGQWTDWVFRIRWSYKNDGILEAWKNGQKVVSQKGPNTFNDRVAPYLKIGIYKPSWNPGAKWAKKAQVQTRTVYHDEVRIAGGKANYNDVAPGRGR